MRSVAFVVSMGILIFASAVALGDDTDNSVDIIQFKSPTGWQATEKPGQPMKIFAAPGSNQQQQAVIVVMLVPPRDNLDLRSAFDDVVKQMAGANKVERTGEPTAAKTRQGFPAMAQQIAMSDAAGNHALVRIVAANVQNRLAAFCYMGGPEAFFKQHEPEMDALLHSVNFNVPTDNAAAGAAAPNPAAAGAAPAAASGDFVAAVHDHTAKAMEQGRADFAKNVEARRKPHTVLGDVLTLDGKPVPNLIKLEVSVGGTTIAAERTNYKLEVDDHGHFEQKVPDGLYQTYAFGIVDLAGHHVPIDLAPLGKTGHDESSDKGMVQDYRIVLDGLKPNADPNGRDAYYGGQVRLSQFNSSTVDAQYSNRFPGSKIQLIFEPQGPLIDGSTGQPFVIEMPSQEIAYSKILQRLPIGPYHVTTKLITADGQTRALNTAQGFNSAAGPTIDVYWQCSPQWENTREDPALYVRD
jgi:hypothetical protein